MASYSPIRLSSAKDPASKEILDPVINEDGFACTTVVCKLSKDAKSTWDLQAASESDLMPRKKARKAVVYTLDTMTKYLTGKSETAAIEAGTQTLESGIAAAMIAKTMASASFQKQLAKELADQMADMDKAAAKA